MSTSRRAGHLALVVLTLVWGYTWVVNKVALALAGPITFSALRSVLGAAALFLAAALLGRRLAIVQTRRTLLLGVLQTTLFMGLSTWALVEGGPGKTSVLIFTMPFWMLIFAGPLLGERIGRPQWIAALLALVGLLLVLEPWRLGTHIASKLAGVAAAIIWALSAIVVKRIRETGPVDLLVLTAWQMLAGGVLLALATPAFGERAVEWSPTFAIALAFITILSTGLGWVLWLVILDRLPAWEASLSILGIPVVAILSSHLQLGEALSPTEFGGVLLIGTGLGLLAWIGKRDAEALPRP